MIYFVIGLTVAAVLGLAAVLIASRVCFGMACYVTKRDRQDREEYPLPKGKIYEPYREQMIQWMKEVRAMPCREFSLRSRDGLLLKGKYYEYAKDAPIELMFHGYRGNAEKDLCGGIQRSFALGHSVLIVDQRACGGSEGNVITFGVKEHEDCLQWIDLALREFGPDVKLYLAGISMGASTVLMAAGKPLPENVVGVLADCGFTSAKEIIQHVIRQMKLPPKLCYPLVRLGARLYGKVDLEQFSAIQAADSCKVPVLLFHGKEDAFVPCQMSRDYLARCASPVKELVETEGAGHGLCYLVDPEGYIRAMQAFFSNT